MTSDDVWGDVIFNWSVVIVATINAPSSIELEKQLWKQKHVCRKRGLVAHTHTHSHIYMCKGMAKRGVAELGVYQRGRGRQL